MFGFELKTFEPAHVVVESLRPAERDWFQMLGVPVTALEAMSKQGPAWSIFKDGLPVSSFGAIPELPHVAEIWQLPSVRVESCYVSYAKFFKQFSTNFLRDYPFTRLQTRSPYDDLHNHWMEFTGFKLEGVAMGYGLRGENYGLWARLR